MLNSRMNTDVLNVCRRHDVLLRTCLMKHGVSSRTYLNGVKPKTQLDRSSKGPNMIIAPIVVVTSRSSPGCSHD